MPSLQPYNQVLGRKWAAHLLRRTTFGPTIEEIDRFSAYTPAEALDELFTTNNNAPAPPVDPATGNSWVDSGTTDQNSGQSELKSYIMNWWMELMRSKEPDITEKMIYFYHTHFTTMLSRVRQSTAIYNQIALFRYYALGNFKELARKLCIDNAMLVFLDGNQNESGRPNENFARELFELYTIGKGMQTGPDDYSTFTETDVREAAKVLSGYKNDDTFSNPDDETGIPLGILETDGNDLATLHDASSKTFSNAFGQTTIVPDETTDDLATREAALGELQQLMDMIFDQDATAIHICKKIYRFFVYYDITETIENDIIIPLAETFKSGNYEIEPVIRQLLESQHFYDNDNNIQEDDNVGAIIKSPLELLMGSLRFFNASVPDQESALSSFYNCYNTFRSMMEEQGLNLYEPFEVAGYKAYFQEPAFNRNWISANILAKRYQSIETLMSGIKDDNDNLLAQIDIVAFVENNIADPYDAESIVQTLVDHLLPEVITQERFDYLLYDVLLDGLSLENWQTEWGNYASGANDDMAVRVQLEKFLKAFAQSPEYQLF